MLARRKSFVTHTVGTSLPGRLRSRVPGERDGEASQAGQWFCSAGFCWPRALWEECCLSHSPQTQTAFSPSDLAPASFRTMQRSDSKQGQCWVSHTKAGSFLQPTQGAESWGKSTLPVLTRRLGDGPGWHPQTAHPEPGLDGASRRDPFPGQPLVRNMNGSQAALVPE